MGRRVSWSNWHVCVTVKRSVWDSAGLKPHITINKHGPRTHPYRFHDLEVQWDLVPIYQTPVRQLYSRNSGRDQEGAFPTRGNPGRKRLLWQKAAHQRKAGDPVKQLFRRLKESKSVERGNDFSCPRGWLKNHSYWTTGCCSQRTLRMLGAENPTLSVTFRWQALPCMMYVVIIKASSHTFCHITLIRRNFPLQFPRLYNQALL